MLRLPAALLFASLAAGCGAPEAMAPLPARDPAIEIRAPSRDVGLAIADGMTQSGYHTRRHEPYVLEFESGGAVVSYSLSERTRATYVLAKITIPDGGDAQDRSFRRFQLSSEVQRFLNGIRSALETAALAAPKEAENGPKEPQAAPPPAPQPDRPGKVLKKLGL